MKITSLPPGFEYGEKEKKKKKKKKRKKTDEERNSKENVRQCKQDIGGQATRNPTKVLSSESKPLATSRRQKMCAVSTLF